MPAKASQVVNPPGAFPAVHAVSRLVDPDCRYVKGLPDNKNQTPVYDVKFCPYTGPDADPIFAVVAGREVLICSPSTDTKEPLQILRVFRDPQEDISLNSVAWCWDVNNLEPLICFAGTHSSKIKVGRVSTGEFVGNLIGHGSAINDLVVSPTYPGLLASASNDHSIRLWNLVPAWSPSTGCPDSADDLVPEDEELQDDRSNPDSRAPSPARSTSTVVTMPPLTWDPNRSGSEPPVQSPTVGPGVRKQPCVAIFAGAGHIEHVLALTFHSNGRYLLSGGSDTMINLWAVPDLPEAKSRGDKTIQVYYPLFSSIEVHGNYVDCLQFHGDLILSHAASGSFVKDSHKNAIHLWKIDGFNSADDVPSDPPLPGPNVFTRSAFGGRFQRLMTFDMPHTSIFYIRFSLLSGLPGQHPMLVMGNEKSKFYFWDLQKLEQGPDQHDMTTAKRAASKRRGGGLGSAARGSSRPTSALARDAQAQARADQTPMSESASVSVPTSALEAGNGQERDNMTPAPIPAAATAATATKTGDALLDAKFDPSDPFRPIPPHHVVTVPRYNFLTRQCAWSNDGKWMIGVGDIGLIVVMKRWN